MTVGADDVIREVLQQSPLFRDREIRILRIGLSGYKQPQQLMTANWLMALGGEFDAIVNLDGYNELALSITENYDRKIHTAYPRAWNARMVELIDPRKSADRMRLLEIDASRQRSAQRIVSVPWRWSFTANVVWLLSDRIALREKRSLTQKMLAGHSRRDGLKFAESGPLQDISSTAEALEISADTWLRCSVQMHRLLSSSGIAYLHVLQPNLYHADSKPLSSEELELGEAIWTMPRTRLRTATLCCWLDNQNLKQRVLNSWTFPVFTPRNSAPCIPTASATSIRKATTSSPEPSRFGCVNCLKAHRQIKSRVPRFLSR
jgi:hypothetical protein